MTKKPKPDNDYEWYDSEYGKFRIEKSRFDLHTSYDEQGEAMLTALTFDDCKRLTPLHMESKSPDYDGRFDLGNYSASVGVKL